MEALGASWWQPTTEQELLDALAGGLLDESHYVDLKREIAPGARANKELARDLASFALDGGLIVVGVDEADDGKHSTTPVLLEGLRERVDQVARSACEPPVHCTIATIRSAEDDKFGYLLIRILASPTAPHMVDGTYYGRSDTTKFKLSDADVLRHHERRVQGDAIGRIALDSAIASDPIPENIRRQAHLFIVAIPLTASDELALEIVAGPGWDERFRGILSLAYQPSQLLGGSRFSPDWPDAVRLSRRADGIAASTDNLNGDRTVREAAYRVEDVLEIQLAESGAMRIFLGRLSDNLQIDSFSEARQQVILDEAALLMTRRVLSVVSGVAQQLGYFGHWSIGVGATGISGLSAYEPPNAFRFTDSAQRYESGSDLYRMVRTFSSEEIWHRPGRVTDLLWGRFLRALSSEKRYRESYLRDADGGDDRKVHDIP